MKPECFVNDRNPGDRFYLFIYFSFVNMDCLCIEYTELNDTGNW